MRIQGLFTYNQLTPRTTNMTLTSHIHISASYDGLDDHTLQRHVEVWGDLVLVLDPVEERDMRHDTN